MSHDPTRWLEGDDARLQAWMELGANDTAPGDALARVAARFGLEASPAAAHGAQATLGAKAGKASLLKWGAALLLAAALSYVLLLRGGVRDERPHASGAPAATRSEARALTRPPAAPASARSDTAPVSTRSGAAPVSFTSGAQAGAASPSAPVAVRAPRAAGRGAAASDPSARSRSRPEAPAASALELAASNAPRAPATHGDAVGSAAAPAAVLDTSTARPEFAPHAAEPARPHLRASAIERPRGTQQAELEQLETAQRALHEQPTRALALILGHAQRFPQSWLAEERDALLVRTYLALHDHVRARAALAQFKQRHPESPALRQLERASSTGVDAR